MPGAVDDLLAVFRMARHVGNEPLIVSNGVGWACEAEAINLLAKRLPHVPSSALEPLEDELQLPPIGNLAVTLRFENHLFVTLPIEEIKKGNRAAALAQLKRDQSLRHQLAENSIWSTCPMKLCCCAFSRSSKAMSRRPRSRLFRSPKR